MWSYLVMWVWMWRCSLRLFVSWWFDFPRRPPIRGLRYCNVGGVLSAMCMDFVVLLVRLGSSVFLVTLVRSSLLAPVTRFRVGRPCPSLLRLRDHVLDTIGVRAVGREMLVAEVPPVVGIRHIGLGAADEIAT